jgi:hypothetical protein
MMNKRHNDYGVVPYPELRRGLAVTLRSAQRTPMIHGLLEVDVTGAREFLRIPLCSLFPGPNRLLFLSWRRLRCCAQSTHV